MIELANATLAYNDAGTKVYAVKHANLSVNTGQFIGLLGPSGSGKSSLLYLLSGLKMPTTGDSLCDGVSYKSLSDKARSALRRKQFGFIFQHPFLLGYLTALENILIASDEPKNGTNKAMELMSALGIADKAHRLPQALSGGEKHRVCIARALINNPQYIFADEPTASLDQRNGLAVVQLLKRYRGNGAVVFVTHDPQMLHEAEIIWQVKDGEVELSSLTDDFAATSSDSNNI